MDEKLDQRLKPIQEDLSQLAGRMTRVETMLETQDVRLSQIKSRTSRVEVLLEHELPKQMQTLSEGHNSILERIPEAEEIDTLRNRVRTLERVVTSHSQEIERFKKGQLA